MRDKCYTFCVGLPNNTFEKELQRKGYKYIAGVDEAGRGPLAGPVVAAAVIFPKNTKIPGLNDSKKLTSRQRLLYFKKIKKKALTFGLGIVDEVVIDKINILKASLLAMRIAVNNLTIKPQYILVDGNRRIGLFIPQKLIIGGDALSRSIAAASILAKVTRDKIMDKLNKSFPEYGFNKNKGYGTPFHLQRLKDVGPCLIHRKSFFPVKDSLLSPDLLDTQQMSLLESNRGGEFLGEQTATG